MEFKYGTYGYIAKKDLARSKTAITLRDTNMCSFYCQQCLEKIGVQYVLLSMGREQTTLTKFSHKLKTIYAKIDLDDIEGSAEALLAITDCYYDTRYPEAYFTLGCLDAEKYLAVTEEIFNKVCSLIESMDRPLTWTVTREFGKRDDNDY